MVVQHNLMAMNANRMLGLTANTVSDSTEKLASGYRINRAADDAAGLAISEKMRKQVRGLTQSVANAEDGISCVQTAEGALAEVQDMLQRMNELCVQAANGTNSKDDRQYIQDELDQLISEIDRIAETTKFNETFLLKGDQTGATNSVYITNYSTTYTKNTLQLENATPTTYCMNYKGTNNIYLVDIEIRDAEPSISMGADTISQGEEMTKYLKKEDVITNTASTNVGKATLNKDAYVAFINAELNSIVVNGSQGNVNGSVDYDLSTDGTSSIVRANQELYVYNTANGTITRLTAGTAMTEYLKDDNTMKDTYRLVDILDSATGTSDRVKEQMMGGNQFYWTNDILEIASSQQKLYNADGLEVSGMALNKYFNNQGNYTGGLYTTSQARAIDEVKSQYDPNQKDINGNIVSTTIGQYITQSSQQVNEDLIFNLHVGAESDRRNKISAAIQTLTSAGIGIDKLASYNIGIVDETGNNATDAIDVVGDALQAISEQRAALGAVQNRLEHTVKNLDNIVENTTAAEAAIRDTDMAEEMVRYANSNILQQAGQSMLAQANQAKEGVLSLLQ